MKKITIDYVEKIYGNRFNIIKRFIKNKRTYFRFKCNVCGEVKDVSSSNIRKDVNCAKCKKNNLNKKYENKFLEFVNNVTNGEYTVVGSYKGSKENIDIRHNICGNIYPVKPNLFKNSNSRCPYCNKYKTYTKEEFIKKLIETHGDTYKLIDEFVNMSTRIKSKHICGHIRNASPTQMIIHGCEKCQSKISNGEAVIEKFLKDNNINYISQYRISECRNKNPLPFDFAIFDNKKNINMLIEFDGIQHFEPRNFFGGIKEFEKRVANDRIKDKYCNNNNIKLLRIAYYDFKNIDNILTDIIL